MMGEEAASEARQAPDGGFRRRLTRACRRRFAELSVHAYRLRHKAGQYRARYGGFIGAAIVVLLVAASAYLLPAVKASPESRFATEEAIQSFQSLLLATGSALIGAAAIATSLVLFAMQVNVERMPHGLFRRKRVIHLGLGHRFVGPLAHGVLQRPTLAIVGHVMRRGLAYVQHRLACPMLDADLLSAHRRCSPAPDSARARG